MGIIFRISAPGRIVLFGEHVAAYEKQFLASSLSCRTFLNFCELDNSAPFNIIFPDIVLQQNISSSNVESLFLLKDIQDIMSNPIKLLEYVKHLITVVKCMWTTYEQRFSLQIFFFLLYYIAYHECVAIKPFYINVSTDIPIGFGSSTSFAVCLAACFIHWQRLQNGPHDKFDNIDLELIKKYTTLCEESMQDYVFASVDAHICTFGQMALCQRTSYKLYTINSADMAEMNILLVDLNIYQSNSVQARQMAMLRDTDSVTFSIILNKIEFMAKITYENLKFISFYIKNNLPTMDTYRTLMICIYWQGQKYLSSHNLSTAVHDNICEIAHNCDFTGKLTGFGGKYVYVLLPPKVTDKQIRKFAIHMSAKGLNVPIIKTSIGCNGVRIEPDN